MISDLLALLGNINRRQAQGLVRQAECVAVAVCNILRRSSQSFFRGGTLHRKTLSINLATWQSLGRKVQAVKRLDASTCVGDWCEAKSVRRA